MSSPRAASNDDDKHSGNSKEAAVAKTTGFIVFSGIAMSILKTLNPFNKERNATAVPQQPVVESIQPSPAQPIRDSPPPPASEPIITKEAGGYTEQRSPEYSQRVIDIVKGDTLWGLSRKYGVSIDAIKEANGLTGDTIYAGKKLIIP
ncbi:hypothetical protein ES332_D04G047000v1 [Gossypium tomentosum]|uniref:LysM domain-containing protein n=1 Tax=Gossypium tomentosum TaxID=34277 RepID=A0A5D2L956_GOSTO|nr:hypothetical protein ES332_D04G047000v1 [Gossypium tomentosum]